MTKGFGFTLAEVLITLGIIGVVAAMTIPTLMVDINTKQWSTAADVFEKKFTEALKNMNTAQTLAGHTTTESFVEELSKHFKTNKICKNNKLQDCFAETVFWGAGEATPEEVDLTSVTTASGFGQTEWGTNIVGLQFANGVSALIAYNPITTGDKACTQDPFSNQVTGVNCYAMLYDTSGFKSPNTSGKDLGGINIKQLGRSCFATVGSLCFASEPIIAGPVSLAECEEMKASGNYGIRECRYDNDYWAGAVKYCGGIQNMPTANQLTELAKYLYNTNNITMNQGSTNDLTLDSEKAASFGFPRSSYDGGSFGIWAGSETSSSSAHYRYFASYYTRDDDYALRDDEPSALAFCLSN